MLPKVRPAIDASPQGRPCRRANAAAADREDALGVSHRMEGVAETLHPPPRSGAVRRGAPLTWLLAGAIVLPLLVAGAGAWMSWRNAWTTAERELVHASDAAAEYARRLLDGHRAAAD